MILNPLAQRFDQFQKEFSAIPSERKKILQEISTYVTDCRHQTKPARLNFICTHNSRRSHISQIWAQAAAAHYSIPNVQCYSGGTEATAFNIRAVNALREAGFKISVEDNSSNPVYQVLYDDQLPPIKAFSKVYSDPFNPSSDYTAVMTCSHADENCPLVIGATRRISLPFNDPKDFDNTPQESKMYAERVHEIGREIAYAFSIIKL